MLITLLSGVAHAQDAGAIDPKWIDKGVSIVTSLVIAVVTLIIAWIVSKWISGIVSRFLVGRGMDAPLAGFLASIVGYCVLGMGVVSALGACGVETTSVVAALGAMGLAVGLALQGTLSNFAAGVMILFFKPFTVGDVVTVGGETGGVSDIGLFATTLITPDNHKIMVANSTVTGGVITNYTTLGVRRTTVEFGVAYGEDIDKIVALAQKAAQGCAVVITDPAPPAVAFTEMGASSINFACHSWSKSEDWLDSMHQVRTAIYSACNEAGIDIPYDQVVMHQAPAA